MKKSLLVLMLTIMVGFLFSGCATWHGAKRDTSQIWDVVTS